MVGLLVGFCNPQDVLVYHTRNLAALTRNSWAGTANGMDDWKCEKE